MAKAKKPQAKQRTGGPYLAAAVFCDSVVKGDDGAMTAVRMIDHITITVPAEAPPDVPSDEKRVLAQIEGLIGFKKGDSKAKHNLRLVINSPSGKSHEIWNQPADFRDEPHGGYNLRMKSGFAISEGGLFWLDVLLDGTLMTRMPLQITVKRAEPELPPVSKPASTRRKRPIDLG